MTARLPLFIAIAYAVIAAAFAIHAEQRYSKAQQRLLCSLFLADVSNIDPKDWQKVKSFDAACKAVLKHRRKG